MQCGWPGAESAVHSLEPPGRGYAVLNHGVGQEHKAGVMQGCIHGPARLTGVPACTTTKAQLLFVLLGSALLVDRQPHCPMEEMDGVLWQL
jgi:hypothetical protein